jgi:hypothetical protein
MIIRRLLVCALAHLAISTQVGNAQEQAANQSADCKPYHKGFWNSVVHSDHGDDFQTAVDHLPSDEYFIVTTNSFHDLTQAWLLITDQSGVEREVPIDKNGFLYFKARHLRSHVRRGPPRPYDVVVTFTIELCRKA